MKKVFVFYLFLSLISCNTITDQNPEGVYVCKFEHEFAKTEDTLLLKRINKNYFTIIRHSGVTSKANSKKQIISEVWKLDYDNNKNVFTEMKTGKVLIWNADKQILIFGNREYVRSNY
jgi:hypothetical protein